MPRLLNFNHLIISSASVSHMYSLILKVIIYKYIYPTISCDGKCVFAIFIYKVRDLNYSALVVDTALGAANKT